MKLEDFLINKIHAGETLSKMEEKINFDIHKIRAEYQAACEFLKSVDISNYDGNTQEDCIMIRAYTDRIERKTFLENQYPEIVLEKDLIVESQKSK